MAIAADEVSSFHTDGFVTIEHFLTAPEAELLSAISRASFQASSQSAEGGIYDAVVNHFLAPNTIFDAIIRSQRMLSTMNALIGEPSYFDHYKMVLKEPRTGGGWPWHQDYAYWADSCLFPKIASCMIAIDASTQQNGCLELLRGSHGIGNIAHGSVGGAWGAEQSRVNAALDRLDLVACELNPGDALFFHCNTLHRSNPNRSDHPRWTLICSFNAASNEPFKPSKHPPRRPLAPIADDQVIVLAEAHWQTLNN